MTIDDDWYKLQMEENSSDAGKWLFHARKLFKAGIDVYENANTENPHADTTNVAYMLIGMSIECYLKSYFIACGNKLNFDKDGKLKTLGGHKLDVLADNVGIDLDKSEITALQWLGHILTYSGRYPLPLNWKDMKSYDEARFNLINNLNNGSLHYDEIYKDLIHRLEREIKQRRNQII